MKLGDGSIILTMKKLINRIKFEIYFFNAIRAQKKRYKKLYPNNEDIPEVIKNAF